MRVSRAQLREPLEELRVVGPLRLLPCRLPRLVRGEEPPSVEVRDAQSMVLLEREVVVVLERQRVRRIPREGTPQLVARAARLRRRVGIARAVRLRRGRSLHGRHSMLRYRRRPPASTGTPTRMAPPPIHAQKV